METLQFLCRVRVRWATRVRDRSSPAPFHSWSCPLQLQTRDGFDFSPPFQMHLPLACVKGKSTQTDETVSNVVDFTRMLLSVLQSGVPLKCLARLGSVR